MEALGRAEPEMPGADLDEMFSLTNLLALRLLVVHSI
jgi:hypothetical protein